MTRRISIEEESDALKLGVLRLQRCPRPAADIARADALRDSANGVRAHRRTRSPSRMSTTENEKARHRRSPVMVGVVRLEEVCLPRNNTALCGASTTFRVHPIAVFR